jgi:hypothetical protein
MTMSKLRAAKGCDLWDAAMFLVPNTGIPLPSGSGLHYIVPMIATGAA